mmetsp:Transcript_32519/g.97881  ORF Transcript_32519/g.97881 Transcript_32519/m.97881 type:complete len:236 (-) Transcript_32519:420-1127(-)
MPTTRGPRPGRGASSILLRQHAPTLARLLGSHQRGRHRLEYRPRALAARRVESLHGRERDHALALVRDGRSFSAPREDDRSSVVEAARVAVAEAPFYGAVAIARDDDRRLRSRRRRLAAAAATWIIRDGVISPPRPANDPRRPRQDSHTVVDFHPGRRPAKTACRGRRAAARTSRARPRSKRRTAAPRASRRAGPRTRIALVSHDCPATAPVAPRAAGCRRGPSRRRPHRRRPRR